MTPYGIPDQYRKLFLLLLINGGIGAIFGWMVAPFYPSLFVAIGFVLGFMSTLLLLSLLGGFFFTL